jgi:hypothetical protein
VIVVLPVELGLPLIRRSDVKASHVHLRDGGVVLLPSVRRLLGQRVDVLNLAQARVNAAADRTTVPARSRVGRDPAAGFPAP